MEFTQFVTEIFRTLGFDGIFFKSSVDNGKNLVVFDPSSFVWIENSGEVYEINKLSYNKTKKPLFDKTNDKYDDIL